MAVCTFLGHNDIYDAEIDSMLQSGIERIVAENEKTEFLIYRCNSFYRKSFLAVLKAKAHHPEDITITLVLSEEDHNAKKANGIPACLIDRILFPNPKDCNSIGHKKVIRWLIQQSTHLISCIYKNFYEQENQIFDYAQSREDLHIVDITDANTAQAILERTTLMSNRERFIFESLNEGRSAKEVTETLGISINRLRQVLNHGCKTVRQSMRNRHYRMSTETQEQRKSVCSVFSVGEVTYESLKIFDYVIYFLLSRCGVTHFEIGADIQHTGFMYVLERYAQSEHILCNITAAAADNDSHMTGRAAEMIGGADFCVCDLSVSPIAEEIRTHIFQDKRTILLDMSKVCEQME